MLDILQLVIFMDHSRLVIDINLRLTVYQHHIRICNIFSACWLLIVAGRARVYLSRAHLHPQHR